MPIKPKILADKRHTVQKRKKKSYDTQEIS